MQELGLTDAFYLLKGECLSSDVDIGDFHRTLSAMFCFFRSRKLEIPTFQMEWNAAYTSPEF